MSISDGVLPSGPRAEPAGAKKPASLYCLGGAVKRRFRLKRRQDFDHVMRAQRVFAGRALVAFALPNPCGHWRVGVAVSRQLKGAVPRNRLRRRLREAARVSLLPGGSNAVALGKAYDVVLIGRQAALDLPQLVLQEEAARLRAVLEGMRP